MNVSTDVFAAVQAENVMLREHAGRGRHRAPRQPRQPGTRRRRPIDGYWQAGRAVAAGELLDLAADVAASGASSGQVLAGVAAAAAAMVEVQSAASLPAAWDDAAT
jgi:hypothetical protein